jgi:hypothetical protein
MPQSSDRVNVLSLAWRVQQSTPHARPTNIFEQEILFGPDNSFVSRSFSSAFGLGRVSIRVRRRLTSGATWRSE